MREQDFPALYQSADKLSLVSQKNFFRALGMHLIALIVAAFLSIVISIHSLVAVTQLIVLLGALACSIYLSAIRPDRLWYAGRAVAESIKTISWRYVCRAEPFSNDDTTSYAGFLEKLKQIVEQNKPVCQLLTEHLGEEQFTSAMVSMRSCSLDDRRSTYVNFRVKDQLTWYAKKAAFNKKMSQYFFRGLIAINGIAVICATVRISYINQPFWPTDIFIAIAVSLLSWMQAKRFSELAASYTLAAHEISLIKEQSSLPSTESEFSQFVGDAENAFSREHTQWVARKDV